MLLKTIIIILINTTFLFPNFNVLEALNIDAKINGIVVYMGLDSLPNKGNLSAWQSRNEWFYITLHQCKVPLNEKLLKNIHEEIIEWEIIRNRESLQLGIKTIRPIEQFNFILDPTAKIVQAHLYYPTTLLAAKIPEKFNQNIIKRNGLARGTKTWLNITGTWLTIYGLLKEEKVVNNSSTLAGISIIVSTFLIDTILKDF